MPSKRTPWKFFKRYCGYTTTEYGWEADGSTQWTDTELKDRLSILKIERDRALLWKDTPPKTRQVVRLDVGVGATTKEQKALAKAAKSEGSLFARLEATLELKLEAVVEGILEDLGAGEKCVAWCLTRKSVERLTDALEEAVNANTVRTLMRQKNVRVWATHGEAPEHTRFKLAETFRRHDGGGVLVVTIDSMPEAISLGSELWEGKQCKGASVEHFVQMHYLHGPMFQAENRPYAKDVKGLHIIYYIAKGTADEHVEGLVVPRIEMLDRMGPSGDTVSVLGVFGKKEETLSEIWDRITKNIPEGASFRIGNENDEEESEEGE